MRCNYISCCTHIPKGSWKIGLWYLKANAGNERTTKGSEHLPNGPRGWHSSAAHTLTQTPRCNAKTETNPHLLWFNSGGVPLLLPCLLPPPPPLWYLYLPCTGQQWCLEGEGGQRGGRGRSWKAAEKGDRRAAGLGVGTESSVSTES